MTHRSSMKNVPEPERDETGRDQSQPEAVTDAARELKGRAATGGMPGGEYEVPAELDAGTGQQAGPGTGWGITSGNPTGFGQRGQPGTTTTASGGEAEAGGERERSRH